MRTKIYDTIIIGAGPAALSASIYASRYFLNHLVIGKTLGGTMANAYKIENYPGIDSISGAEMAEKMKAQAQKLNAKIIHEEVKRIKKNQKQIFELTISGQSQAPILSHSIILAIGMQRRELNIPGEKEFMGHGVSYCSTCDAAFFKDKTVVVVGGANAAAMAAIHLAQYAAKVYLIYRGPALKGEPAWNQRVIDHPKIQTIFNTNITKISGASQVEQVSLDKKYQERDKINCQGVFIEIGLIPSTSLARHLGVKLTQNGFIDVNPAGQTNVPGVLAAGDITNGSNNFRQIVTAVSEGAITAKSAFDLKAQRDKSKEKIDYA
ncbi:MAG: FAD-dependent oxidoreductase [Patescibacteria group bacterium]